MYQGLIELERYVKLQAILATYLLLIIPEGVVGLGGNFPQSNPSDLVKESLRALGTPSQKIDLL